MKMKKIVFVIIAVLILSLTATTVQAASTSIEATSYEVEQGQSVTVKVSFTAAAWNLTVSGDKITGASYASPASDLSEVTTTKSFTMDTSTPGSYTATLSGDITDATGTVIPVSKSITVKVNEKVEVAPEPQPEPTPEPELTPEPEPTPEPEKPVEPTFSNANKTMYATGDINLRASWSTDSAATRIEKGTELTVIGTSTETVNGYVWYRVSYEGKTRYVASSLLTSEKPEEENEKEKANANLKSLTVEGFSLSPSFSPNTLEYTMQVEMDTEKLDIKAETENEKATVKIEGNETLAEGENTVKVIVTAEDGTTTKTYVIKVTKQEEIFGLLSLIIKDTNIADTFKTDVYEYEIDVENIDMLDIEAIATQEDATIEIIGNENLLEGENFITIMVKSKDETQTVTYQIKVNRLVVIDEPEETGTIDIRYIIYGAIGVVLLVTLVGVVIYFIKHRKEENFFEDVDDFNYYPEDLPEKEEYEYYAEDLPEKKVEEKNYFEEEDYQEEYEGYEDYEENEEVLQESIKEDKSNYFLEDPDDWGEYKNKNKRGKHF